MMIVPNLGHGALLVVDAVHRDERRHRRRRGCLALRYHHLLAHLHHGSTSFRRRSSRWHRRRRDPRRGGGLFRRHLPLAIRLRGYGVDGRASGNCCCLVTARGMSLRRRGQSQVGTRRRGLDGLPGERGGNLRRGAGRRGLGGRVGFGARTSRGRRRSDGGKCELVSPRAADVRTRRQGLEVFLGGILPFCRPGEFRSRLLDGELQTGRYYGLGGARFRLCFELGDVFTERGRLRESLGACFPPRCFGTRMENRARRGDV